MSRPDLSQPGMDELAREVLTDRQYEALRLAHEGMGYRRIGLALGIDPSSAKDRVKAATRRLNREHGGST